MAVGFPSDKLSIDQKAGSLVSRYRDLLEEIKRFDAWVAEQSTSDLIAKGYTQADVDDLRASFNALAKHARIAVAQDTAPTLDNFFYVARKLIAFN